MTPALIQAAITLRDGIGLDDLAALCAAVMTICGFVWWLLRPLAAHAKRFERFWEDWEGTPAAPGRDAVPGVMERLQRIDGELKRNGGSSMKDRVFTIERKLDDQAAVKKVEHAEIRGAIEGLRLAIEGDS